MGARQTKGLDTGEGDGVHVLQASVSWRFSWFRENEVCWGSALEIEFSPLAMPRNGDLGVAEWVW
jgi:hypothetical protein